LLEKGRERGQNRWAESFTLKKVYFRPALFLILFKRIICQNRKYVRSTACSYRI